MGRKMTVPRVLIPVLGMIALALVVKGVEAQDDSQQAPHRAWSSAPAPATVYSFRTGSGSYLGVYIREVNEEDVDRLDLKEERGALITEVPDDGPAAEAGLQTDDVIVSWNGSRIESAAQLTRVVGETPAGRSVEVGYVRDGRQRTTKVEVADRSPAIARVFPGGGLNAEGRAQLERSLDGMRTRLRSLDGNGFAHLFMRGGRLGVGVQSLGDQLADYFGAEDGGVLVSSVREDSPAEKAGLKAGDVILRVGDEKIEDPGDLMTEINRADAGDIELRILRDRKQRTVKVTLPDRNEDVEMSSGNAWFFAPGANAPVPSIEAELPELDLDLRMPEIAVPVAPAEPTIRT
ncbi:MAG: PDZ domain-containing protein [Gemmatimonadales bacterium]|jgi:predicted metalloprotease with PDZ domain